MKKTNYVKTFDEFVINEESSDNNDSQIENLFASLTRNYESKKMFYTDLVQFVSDEEIRDWEELHKVVKLEHIQKQNAKYKLIFKLDNRIYTLNLNFSFRFNGTKEKDAPETATEYNLNRLNIILSDVEIKKIHIDSNYLTYDKSGSSISSSILKKCKEFILKMMREDYDTLDASLATLEQS